MTTPDLQTALDRTKIALMQKADSAFFTAIAFSLKFVWDETCSTAYVDGVHMGWNPTWFMTLTHDERVGVMVHEACHVAYDHIGRLNLGKKRCPDIYNQAADHVINLMLLERQFKLPAIRLADPRFKGMDTEQVYNVLESEASAGQTMPNMMADLRAAGEPGSGNADDSPGGTGMTPDILAQHVRDIIVRASIQSQIAKDKPGTIPGEIELYLNSLLKPKLPWQTILRRYFTEFNKNDYSWKKPNRRFFPDHYLPSLHSQSLQDMTFYVDISGSVEDFQFQIFVSEIAGVLRFLKPKNITIVQFDTKIHHVDKVRSLQELKQIKFHGRGGTHVECILKHMEKNKNSLSLVFTDGGFHFPREEFKHRVLWLINDNPSWVPRFGDVIHFNTRTYS